MNMAKFMCFSLFVASLLLFTACHKDDDDTTTPNKELVVGDWKFAGFLVLNKPENSASPITAPEGCGALQTWSFNADGSHHFIHYEKSGNDCVESTRRTGTYTFNENTKDLAITYPNETETFSVYKVTETEMWWNLGTIDYNGNTTDYLHILVFKK